MLSEEQRQSLVLAQEMYSSNLERAIPYLKSRGIDLATASSRGLGFVTEPIKGHKNAKGRLSIPYQTPAGVIGFTFRCIQDHNCKEIDKHSKYWKPGGSPPELYGVLDVFKDTLDIHIAEGEIDTITLSELCSLPALGFPGATNWRPWWKNVLQDFQRVFVWSDPDVGGDSMINKLQKELGRSAIHVQLPEGYDVNALYLERGPEFVRGLF